LQAESPAALLARLTAELIATPDASVTFERVVEASVGFVPGADHASLTVPDRRAGARTLASTSDLALRCDELQYQLGEGPCVEALTDNEWYRTGDVGSDPRWPRWGPRAAAEGAAAMVAVRLTVRDHPIGALNLYSESTDQFGDTDTLDLVFLYAMHAAGAISAVNEIAGLRTGMENRHTIGVAQGILMQRYELSLERSFELLRRYSNARNAKLRDVAAYVLEHHELPDMLVPSARDELEG
jgi:transcriptional regulator with GAF, ATPase, and Fis domain